jgi:hypothetical protein
VVGIRCLPDILDHPSPGAPEGAHLKKMTKMIRSSSCFSRSRAGNGLGCAHLLPVRLQICGDLIDDGEGLLCRRRRVFDDLGDLRDIDIDDLVTLGLVGGVVPYPVEQIGDYATQFFLQAVIAAGFEYLDHGPNSGVSVRFPLLRASRRCYRLTISPNSEN